MTKDELFQQYTDLYQMVYDEDCTLDQLILVADPKKPEKLCDLLNLSDREDDLRKLVDCPIFGEEAKKELETRKWEDEQDKRWKEKVANYPEPIKTLSDILSSKSFRKGIGIMSVSYPSLQAVHYGMGDNYFAVAGDGLYLYLIEVVSLEGEGKFRISPDPPFKPLYSKQKRGPNSYLNEFCDYASCEIGDELNSEQLIEHFTGLYGDYRE
jgi:hypothetical protein